MTKSEKPEVSVEVAPKIFLDADIQKEINRHYSACLKDELLGRECFSDPKLESHVCNVRARLDGGKTCTRCGHKVGRPCEITCDIHHFCLAVYAIRLGVCSKAKTRAKLIKDNLGRPFQDLYADVMERHALRASMSTFDSPEEAPAVEEPLEKDERLTIAQAAKVCGCSHAKMRSFVDSGKLETVKKGRAVYLRKGDVEEFKASLVEN